MAGIAERKTAYQAPPRGHQDPGADQVSSLSEGLSEIRPAREASLRLNGVTVWRAGCCRGPQRIDPAGWAWQPCLAGVIPAVSALVPTAPFHQFLDGAAALVRELLSSLRCCSARGHLHSRAPLSRRCARLQNQTHLPLGLAYGWAAHFMGWAILPPKDSMAPGRRGRTEGRWPAGATTSGVNQRRARQR